MSSPLVYWSAWWASLTVAERVVAVVFTGVVVGLLFSTVAAAEPASSVRLFVPIDVVALVQAVFTGIAAVAGAFAAVYAVVAAARSKRAEAILAQNAIIISKVKDTVDLVERNTNSLTTQIANAARLAGVHEGEARGKLSGEDTARTLAQGQKEGAATERARGEAAVGAQTPPDSIVAGKESPISVAESRTATATEGTATASERVASAAERTVIAKNAKP